MSTPAESNELKALRETAAHLTASIDARNATPSQSADFQFVTGREQARLNEVTAEIARLAPTAAPSSSSSAASSSSSAVL